MNIFRNAVFAAALAGILAGFVMTALQATFTVPLILQAETFEGAAASHDHAAAEQVAPGHSHGEEAWAPADGFERLAFTALANVVTGIGFALLLIMASELAGGIAGWRQGLIWGLAGFAAFTLAPGLGLPPELPAMPAADLLARQVWWVGTVGATAAGLALIAFRSQAVWALLGVVLLVAPHIVGAPQPVSHETPVPAELHHRFVVAVTVTNLVFWLVLGAAAALARTRFATGLSAKPQRRLA
ncbi:CbtA family protein [Nitratireductor sp. ZSWI3]|uniref:CbtA family protein n=1 Tax=Nitratireductor sp. ZSWI3 TaxID=2966359 RepID=UPI00214F8BCE|nr:CbtA family protein [Nitratireductor sp. ZSWI3]MCR4269366.1 CbtA family protein [Nitratireductor sp. ZSWI3]